MNLIKIFSVILALTILANPAFSDDSQAFNKITVSEEVHHQNADGYLSEPQISKLKSAVSENVKSGKAARANVEGANVSGLGSTTDEDKDGKEVYTVFVGDFESDSKNYAIITLLDAPEALKATYGFNSSGWNAVPLAGEIIKNIANK